MLQRSHHSFDMESQSLKCRPSHLQSSNTDILVSHPSWDTLKAWSQSSLPRPHATIAVSERKGIVRMYNASAISLPRSWRPKMGVECETSFRVFDRHAIGQGLTDPQLRSAMISHCDFYSCYCEMVFPCVGARESSLPRELDSGSKCGSHVERLRACHRPCRLWACVSFRVSPMRCRGCFPALVEVVFETCLCGCEMYV